MLIKETSKDIGNLQSTHEVVRGGGHAMSWGEIEAYVYVHYGEGPLKPPCGAAAIEKTHPPTPLRYATLLFFPRTGGEVVHDWPLALARR